MEPLALCSKIKLRLRVVLHNGIVAGIAHTLHHTELGLSGYRPDAEGASRFEKKIIKSRTKKQTKQEADGSRVDEPADDKAPHDKRVDRKRKADHDEHKHAKVSKKSHK